MTDYHAALCFSRRRASFAVEEDRLPDADGSLYQGEEGFDGIHAE